MRPRSIELGQMGGSGCGKKLVLLFFLGMYSKPSNLEEEM